MIETRGTTHAGPKLAQAFAELLSRRVGVELRVQLVAPGGTASTTQIDARQKPVRLVDERPKVAR